MAEKEERYISITQMVAKENIETEKYQVMPRQDAINRMAKAFFKSWYGEGFEQEHPDLKRRYIESAEAALNALLEDK